LPYWPEPDIPETINRKQPGDLKLREAGRPVGGLSQGLTDGYSQTGKQVFAPMGFSV
jgi:hypothetical protein